MPNRHCQKTTSLPKNHVIANEVKQSQIATASGFAMTSIATNVIAKKPRHCERSEAISYLN